MKQEEPDVVLQVEHGQANWLEQLLNVTAQQVRTTTAQWTTTTAEWVSIPTSYASTVYTNVAAKPERIVRMTCRDRHQYRIGDRVKKVTTTDGPPVNAVGIVLYVSDAGENIGVRWDTWTGGHDGNYAGMHCDAGHGWYMTRRQIRYLGMRVNPAPFMRSARRRR